MPRDKNPNIFQKSFFIFYPANTFPLPPAIDEPQAIASPILASGLLLTNTVPLPAAAVLS
jgi:hypothetical protein